jgi:hypothetical protein
LVNRIIGGLNLGVVSYSYKRTLEFVINQNTQQFPFLLLDYILSCDKYAANIGNGKNEDTNSITCREICSEHISQTSAGIEMLSPQIGVVLPTLGARPEMILGCINSIRKSGAHYIAIVSPHQLPRDVESLVDKVINDPGLGLAAAINLGMEKLPERIEYSTWIGDDDLFEENGLSILAEAMRRQPELSLAYGVCTYIDGLGKVLGVNKAGNIAWRILQFGPDLIPQPSSLFKLRDFRLAGGLNQKYKNAFDFDLFLKLKKIGKARYVPVKVSKFRWHEGSLSVNQRWRAVVEASVVRRSHLNRGASLFSILWEPPVILLTYLAGRVVNARSR